MINTLKRKYLPANTWKANWIICLTIHLPPVPLFSWAGGTLAIENAQRDDNTLRFYNHLLMDWNELLQGSSARNWHKTFFLCSISKNYEESKTNARGKRRSNYELKPRTDKSHIISFRHQNALNTEPNMNFCTKLYRNPSSGCRDISKGQKKCWIA